MGRGDFVGVVAGSGDSGEVRPCPCRETVARVEVSQSLRLFCGLYFHFPTCIGLDFGLVTTGQETFQNFMDPLQSCPSCVLCFLRGILCWSGSKKTIRQPDN